MLNKRGKVYALALVAVVAVVGLLVSMEGSNEVTGAAIGMSQGCMTEAECNSVADDILRLTFRAHTCEQAPTGCWHPTGIAGGYVRGCTANTMGEACIEGGGQFGEIGKCSSCSRDSGACLYYCRTPSTGFTCSSACAEI